MEIKREKENVLYYTDGHAVTVTDAGFKVKRKWYSLNGITRHGFLIIPPARLPGIAFITVGAILVLFGVVGLLPQTWLQEVTFLDRILGVNDVSIGIGAILIITGCISLIMITEKYAVSITTAEGEKHVVISKSKEYISQIVHALNEAFFARLDATGDKEAKKNFMVSGR